MSKNELRLAGWVLGLLMLGSGVAGCAGGIRVAPQIRAPRVGHPIPMPRPH